MQNFCAFRIKTDIVNTSKSREFRQKNNTKLGQNIQFEDINLEKIVRLEKNEKRH